MDKVRKDQDWVNLCDYIKKEILQYDDNLKPSRYLYLRLRGLISGNFIANKKQKPLANYDCKTILITAKVCKFNLVNCLKTAKDEKHKINLIMMFIENEINDVVNRLENAKKAKEKTENIVLDHVDLEGADYTPKSKKVNNKDLNELW